MKKPFKYEYEEEDEFKYAGKDMWVKKPRKQKPKVKKFKYKDL
jgi:hypothetical protein